MPVLGNGDTKVSDISGANILEMVAALLRGVLWVSGSLLNTALSAAQSLAKFCPGSAYLSGGVPLVCQGTCLLESSLWVLPPSAFCTQKVWKFSCFFFFNFQLILRNSSADQEEMLWRDSSGMTQLTWGERSRDFDLDLLTPSPIFIILANSSQLQDANSDRMTENQETRNEFSNWF